MSDAGALASVSPIGDSSRPRRLVKVVVWLAALAAVLVVLDLTGVDVRGWISDFWDTLNDISVGYLVAAVTLQTVQTTFTALAWLFILRAAYPRAELPFGPILTAYAVSVALNGVLPANLGTLVMLFMFVAIVPGSSFAGVFSGYLVHKIFYTVVGALVYLYLFLSIPGSFSVELSALEEHPALTVAIVAGGIFLLVILGRIFWSKLRGLWEKAKQGGAILASPRAYVVRVLLPQAIGYAAKLGVIAIFLAAYSIPVTFDSIMHVVGGNSIANVTSVTPGGVGVNQAMNVVALEDYTDSQTATAYSLAQQLVTTAWNILFAAVLVVAVFGWTGGRALVKTSYDDAKVRAAEMRRRKDTEETPPEVTQP